MLDTTRASRGRVVAPHHLAAESGLAILKEGGNAIEAAADTLGQLGRAGHRVAITRAFDSAMGHAGTLALHPNGVIEGASDPRGDGSAAGFRHRCAHQGVGRTIAGTWRTTAGAACGLAEPAIGCPAPARSQGAV